MIVVTGAAGQLGRLVTAELGKRMSPAGIRLATRDPSKLAGGGFAVVRGDFDDAASLEAAFAGARTALLISGDAPNEVRIRQHRAAIDAAKRAGLGRLVYTSFINASPESRFPFAWIHADTEAYLKSSGLGWTILRNGAYAENLGNAIAQAKATGTLAIPGAKGKVAYISRADIAAATAAVLAGDGHAGKAYELTGPEALDLAGIAAAFGRPVQVVDADPAAYGKILASVGLPPFLVEALIGLYAAAAAGEYAAVSPDAARLAGRTIEPASAVVRRLAS
jgi:NAD(P)H dehydrogenase (quinone)